MSARRRVDGSCRWVFDHDLGLDWREIDLKRINAPQDVCPVVRGAWCQGLLTAVQHVAAFRQLLHNNVTPGEIVDRSVLAHA